MAVHCVLLFPTSDTLSTFYSILVKLDLQSSFVILKEHPALGCSYLFFFRRSKEFKASSMPGLVPIWAMYFWAYLGALAWHSLMEQPLNAWSLVKKPTVNRSILFCCGPSNFAFLWVEQLIGEKKKLKVKLVYSGAQSSGRSTSLEKRYCGWNNLNYRLVNLSFWETIWAISESCTSIQSSTAAPFPGGNCWHSSQFTSRCKRDVRGCQSKRVWSEMLFSVIALCPLSTN